AIVYNPYQANGVGPVMFGGFSFDPLKKRTKLWSKFSDSLFHIPKFMYSVIKGQAYLTTNIVCTQNDDESLIEKTGAERRRILSSLPKTVSDEPNMLLQEIEIHPELWMD